METYKKKCKRKKKREIRKWKKTRKSLPALQVQ